MFNKICQCCKFIVLCSSSPDVVNQVITNRSIIILRVNVEDVFW